MTRTQQKVGRSLATASALAMLALASWTATASAAPGNCAPSVYMGSRWSVAARGVSCLYAKTWLVDMYNAKSLPGGKWTGPPGWFCVKVQRDPGHVQRGVCGTKSGKLMAWMVIAKA